MTHTATAPVFTTSDSVTTVTADSITVGSWVFMSHANVMCTTAPDSPTRVARQVKSIMTDDVPGIGPMVEIIFESNGPRTSNNGLASRMVTVPNV